MILQLEFNSNPIQSNPTCSIQFNSNIPKSIHSNIQSAFLRLAFVLLWFFFPSFLSISSELFHSSRWWSFESSLVERLVSMSIFMFVVKKSCPSLPNWVMELKLNEYGFFCYLFIFFVLFFILLEVLWLIFVDWWWMEWWKWCLSDGNESGWGRERTLWLES